MRPTRGYGDTLIEQKKYIIYTKNTENMVNTVIVILFVLTCILFNILSAYITVE